MAAIQDEAGVAQLAPAYEVRTVDLATGVTLPYVAVGSPSGVPMVFLHGVTDTWRSWETVLPDLPGSIRAFALTQRGHGDADHPGSGFRYEDFAGDLAAFLDAFGIEQAVIVGHSMGSAIAQRFALDYPERVLGLALIGSATTWHGNDVVSELWETGVSQWTDAVDADFVRMFQESPRLAPERFEIAVEESLKAPVDVWQKCFQTIMSTDHSAELSRIEAPTLIVWGDQDPLCSRAEQYALLAAIAGSRLEVYAEGWHNLHWEEPRRFAADLAAHVARIGR